MEYILENLSPADRKIINEEAYLLYPKKILFDNELEAKAKLLYIQIFALTNDEFYCEIENDKLAKLCGCSVRTIQRLMASLVKKFYIVMKFELSEINKSKRKIYIKF